MRKILIINIFGIGDVLFSTPLVKAVRANVPEAFIGYIGNARTAPMLEQWPLVDKVYSYDRDSWAALSRMSRREFLKKMAGEIGAIRKIGYDLVIDLSMNASAGFLMFVAGIPVRLGYDYKGRGRFLNRKIRLTGFDDKHVTEYYLDLIGKLGWKPADKTLTIPVTPDHERRARDWMKNHFKPDQPVVVVVPGGGSSWGKDARYKRWPADHFACLADKIIEKFKAGIILLGSREERELCHHVRAVMRNPAVEFCDEPDLLQSAAVMAAAGSVICNDGGPLHMAVAAGARTAAIFGPVNENVYGPWPPQGHTVMTSPVACRPCYRQFRRAACDHISCLSRLSVDEVFTKIEGMLTAVTRKV